MQTIFCFFQSVEKTKSKIVKEKKNVKGTFLMRRKILLEKHLKMNIESTFGLKSLYKISLIF